MLNSRMTKVAVVFCFIVVGLAVRPARAQKFEVIHTFHSGKGPQGPSGRLILGPENNLYGIAGGGDGKCWANNPCGTVFKMTRSGKLLWVYSFHGPDGNGPIAGVLQDADGNLFGVTENGGRTSKLCDDNVTRICGVVFKLDPTGKRETVLHRFAGGTDGWIPQSIPVEDSTGNLYGTTLWGGLTGVDYGVLYKVTQSGTYTVLHTFQSLFDGGLDSSGVFWGSPGILYGANGTVLFQVNASTGKDTSNIGTEIDSLPIEDAQGNLYGTSFKGGDLKCDGSGEGCGVIYELQNTTWNQIALYQFNFTDGSWPSGGLVRDAKGNLYGTTEDGGIKGSNCNGGGCGVVFKLDPAGNVTLLHAFTGGTDGSWPYGGLTIGPAGRIYGTAAYGGDYNCNPNDQIKDCGVVFKITP